MAVNRTNSSVAYGLTNALQELANPPIVSQRSPSTSDKASLGTVWVNEPLNAYWVCTGNGIWTAQTAGTGTFPAVSVTGNVGDVLVVAAGGDTDLGGDLTVAGVSTFNGNVAIHGDLTADGDWDLESNNAITFVSHSNTNPALTMLVDGGTTAIMDFQNTTGTAANSIVIESTAGGVVLSAINSGSANSIRLLSQSGGISLESVIASQFAVTGVGQDLVLSSTGGSIPITATESIAGAVTITASGAAGTSSDQTGTALPPGAPRPSEPGPKRPGSLSPGSSCGSSACRAASPGSSRTPVEAATT